METLNKPLVTTLLLFLVLCDVSLATAEKMTEDQKSTYIIHVAKSEMPESFEHHLVWYKSVLNSVADSAEMLYTYENAIHGFSTRLTPEEVRLLKSQTGILKVLPEKMYKPLTTRTPHFLGLDKMTHKFPQSKGGSDIIVGVLDTGVWPESKSFDDAGLGPIPSSWKGKCESGTNFTASNCNKKLIGARFFLKGYEAQNGRVDETKQFRSPRDDDGHGTHTASTAAGSAVKGASLLGFATGTARGMATRARVAVYKVCWGEGCAVSDILAAMDKAISDNVNVISVSLGGEPLKYDDDTLSIGAFAAMEKGIVVSCSAGNSGPSLSSISNLAPWVITVGAGTLDREFSGYVSLGNGKNYSGVTLYTGKGLPHTVVPFISAENASGGIGAIGIIGAKQCEAGTLDPKKVKGKIVLCYRGDSSRTAKGLVVKSAGGIGMVLANVEEDGEDLLADAHLLPAIAVGFKAAKAIKDYLSSSSRPKATIVFQGTKMGIKPSPVVAAFSSRGPNVVSPEILKPDFIAPGVDILAAWSKLVGPTNMDEDDRRVDFNIISGTSMSCPHASGIAALVKSAHPKWSPAMIRSAIMTTAYTAYRNGTKLLDSATEKPSTPLAVGAGHVNPIAALKPGLVYDLTVHDYLNFLCALKYSPDSIEAIARKKHKCDASKHYSVADLNYPSFAVLFKPAAGAHGASTTVVKHTRTLTNVGAAGTYKASVMLDIPNVNVSVQPDVLSFKKNERKSYTVTFSATDLPRPYEFGFGRLEWSNGKKAVESPISVTWDNGSD